ncbi:phosphotransferase [Propionibacteriaceae bacterium Y1923]|uniref:phosphotransferase n=1 Tax=Aestuariimicrobium sp. Y1814 TaxID=3418742 RepID=UPI003C27DEAA
MSNPTNMDLLQQSFERNPEWAGKSYTHEPVPGGLTNFNFKLRIDGVDGEVFAKIPGPGTEAFIDRNAANLAAVQAAEAGISPKVYFLDEQTGVEYSEFIGNEYRTATTLDFQDMDVFGKVMDVYRQWHATPALADTKTMFDMVDEHYDQVKADNIELPAFATEVLANYERAKERYLAAGLTMVPAHNDPMPGNFLLSDDKPVKLLDFEYAANNDVAYELGVLLCEMFVSEENTRLLVERYLGHFDEKFFARVMISRMIADTKWGLWGLINNAVRNEEFDYYKYGAWKLYRTFTISRHPDFETWLEQI